MEFRVLGAVEAWSDGLRVDIGSRKQRLVLAVLLLEANHLVSLDRLIDLTWPRQPPASARSTVQVLISRLRGAFRQVGGPKIDNEGAGYLLRVDPLAVDVHRFADLTARARAADDAPAVVLFDQALALWRGDPLGDVAPDEVRDRLSGGLREARWTAVEDRIDARLRLGESRQVLGELTGFVAEHPVRQRLVGQLMLALYREGRTNDALDAYRGLRRRLSDEFGLDPTAELRALETSILRADPSLDAQYSPAPEPVRPAELPHDARGFVGRDAELAKLDAGLLSPGIWVISGTAGVGKTALAVHWAHRSRGSFPDGQLYLDLRGFDAEHEPLEPTAALTQLLRGLGADPRLVPPDLDGQAKLFRSLLADREVLLVLDNARSADQVAQLIPPSGTVVITSRQRLGELVARSGARVLPLDVLPAVDSLRLLEVVLGAGEVAEEVVAATELARLCGHLPLALRIAAANISAGSEIPVLARELAKGDPLAELTVDGAEESAVSTALALSYRALSEDDRRMFRRLGLVPGQTFTAQSAGAIAELPAATAGRQLKALAAAHLVERHSSTRYRLHDLLRRYALDRGAVEDPEAELTRAREALFDHYLLHADAAGRQLIPHFLRLPRELPEATPFDDTDSALAWLDAEWPNVTAAISRTAKHGPRHYSWHLADALRAFFHHRGHRMEWLVAASTALEAAQGAGDKRAQAAMHLSIGLACVNTGAYGKAREHLTTALRDNLADGWYAGQGAVLNNLSAVHQRLGNPQEAITCGQRSLELTTRYGQGGGVVMSLANLGFAYWQLGALDQAGTHFARGLELGEQTGARFNVAVLLVDQGNVYRDLGNHDLAEEFYAKALAANRELGYRYGEATALSGRALLRCATGPSEQTHADAEAAVELTRLIGDHGTEAWTLNALGTVCLSLGRAADAERHHRHALGIAQETSFYWCEADALTGLAEALPFLGRLDQARANGEKALELARRAGYRLVEIRALRALADTHVRLGDGGYAEELREVARRLAADTGYQVGEADDERVFG